MSSHHGTIWIATKDVLVNCDKEEIGKRKVLIEKGTIIEWRYSSNHHFRTIDDCWFWVETDEDLADNFAKIGNILEDVRWKNIAKLDDIWRLKLFNWVDNGQIVYKSIKELEADIIVE